VLFLTVVQTLTVKAGCNNVDPIPLILPTERYEDPNIRTTLKQVITSKMQAEEMTACILQGQRNTKHAVRTDVQDHWYPSVMYGNFPHINHSCKSFLHN